MSWKEKRNNIVDVIAEFPFEKHYSYGHVKTSDDGQEITLTNNFGISTTLQLEFGEMGEPNYSTRGRGWNVFPPLYMHPQFGQIIEGGEHKIYSWGQDGTEDSFVSEFRKHIAKHYNEMFEGHYKFNFNGGASCYASQFWSYQEFE